YEIIKKLGEGRSSVYLCRDIEFPEKEYAIKILPPVKDSHEQEIFIKEFFTLQRLEHPGIIEAFEFGTVFHTDGEKRIETGSTFITMEYFEGEELLSVKNNFNEKNLKEIVKQICTVLYYLHQSKYIYYDLKPENILVSFKDENPRIKLIDLGLAEYSPSPSDYEIKGTAYYIAPELLKKESHIHSVDFYSLGIILYQIIYKRFPFDAKSELDIYKSAIENAFDFPFPNSFSQEFINIVKKLLEKDVEKRYRSALEVISDLGFSLDISTTKEFLPAKVYSCRDNVINMLTKYIADRSSSEVCSIKGFDGVGKTSLIQKMQELNPDAVLISDVKGKSAEELISYLLRQIIFSNTVYPNLSEEEKLTLLNLLRKSEREIVDELRLTVALLTSKSKFVLLIDDFNLYDPLVSDLLVEIIPLLQVNNIKVIIAESSAHSFLSSRINNVKEITLGSFTKDEMILFLEESYSSEFPKEHLEKLITSNADLIPGNIKSFIKDLILFGIMKFSESGVFFSDEEKKISNLTEAHSSIYDLRLANLSKQELASAKIISALNIYIDLHLLSLIIGLSREETEKIILQLQLNNIIQKFASGQTLVFTSDAIKKYIYASIENKKKLHLQIAKKLTEIAPSLNRLEEARQYEIAGDLEKCFSISMDEIKEAEKHSAFTYIQRILSHLLNLSLEKKIIDAVKIKLSEVYFKLGDVQSSLKTIKELKNTLPLNQIDNRLFVIEGSALIASGEYESGKEIILELLNNIDHEDEKRRLKVELAYADFELKLYEEARELCKTLLEEKSLSPELTGRCYNLKGMIDIYQENDLNSALENFRNAKSKFSEAGQPARVAGAEVNIGNIYSIQKNYEKAEMHWKSASEINQSIGNLEQEGILLQSFGTFYFYRTKYNTAIQSYLRARNIFLSLGNEIGLGQVLSNLGEVNISICEYQNALDSLSEARSLFERTQNYLELSDVLFIVGKLYFKAGFYGKLEEAFVEFNFSSTKLNLPGNYEHLGELFRQWVLFSKVSLASTEKLSLISEEFSKNKDSSNLLECSWLLVRFFIQQKKYREAIEEINKPELVDLCSQNSILEAEREYFLGVISKNYESDKLLSPLVYFEKAYDLIKDESVTELTWKVLYEISQLYVERGNYTKAKRFVVYARELIYFIAEKLESPQLRAAYLKNSERLETLKKLESFYPG
ncbi:MAG: protein kinase, partial [Ignavibacteriaceae bacterium]|nr:protein kinase [Ignavibacteriaceae bacterium]